MIVMFFVDWRLIRYNFTSFHMTSFLYLINILVGIISKMKIKSIESKHNKQKIIDFVK